MQGAVAAANTHPTTHQPLPTPSTHHPVSNDTPLINSTLHLTTHPRVTYSHLVISRFYHSEEGRIHHDKSNITTYVKHRYGARECAVRHSRRGRRAKAALFVSPSAPLWCRRARARDMTKLACHQSQPPNHTPRGNVIGLPPHGRERPPLGDRQGELIQRTRRTAYDDAPAMAEPCILFLSCAFWRTLKTPMPSPYYRNPARHHFLKSRYTWQNHDLAILV